MKQSRRPDGTQPGDNRLMMQHPEFWPRRPVLTLKKEIAALGDMPETGLLYEDTMADGTCFRFSEGILGLLKLEDLLEAPEITIDKLLEDGWVVD